MVTIQAFRNATSNPSRFEGEIDGRTIHRDQLQMFPVRIKADQ